MAEELTPEELEQEERLLEWAARLRDTNEPWVKAFRIPGTKVMVILWRNGAFRDSYWSRICESVTRYGRSLTRALIRDT
jgi:hypothetical protein